MVLLAIMMVFIIVACNQEQEQPAATYTVTFESEGGSPIDPATVTVTEGAKVKKPAEPTREGYYFGGWWTKNKLGNYSTPYNFSKAVKKDLTLYARWYNTEYYMPAGWASTVTTPMWTTKDEGTVTVPAAVLQGDAKSLVTNVTPELEAALAAAVADDDYFKPAKNIIIIISDGMGVTHVQASEQWSGDLIMTKLPNVGISMTKTREDEITDSAAGGTALATGYKTTKLFVSMDAEGNDLKTVSELARGQGKLVGIVTNAELEDATPADFSIHNKNRSASWSKVAEQEVVFGADLFMGNDYSGYASYFNSTSPLYQFTVDNNMKLYSSAANMITHFGDDSKMWAIFAGAANKFARYDTPDEDKPNLQQMTAYALAWLDSHADEDKGFIVMIENTYTDYFGHGYDSLDGAPNTFNIVKEVQSTDEAVAIALKYVLEHPDTALIVTADHETGSTQLRDGWKTDFTNITAGSGNHSAQDVPVFAIGKGTEDLDTLGRTEAERAAGAKWDKATPYENYRIGQVIGNLLGNAEFGGENADDHSSRISPKFEITTTAAASSITFTLELKGVPVDEGNYIQFKIKPVNSSDKLTVSVQSADGKKTTEIIKKTVLSSTDSKILEFSDPEKYYSAVPLMKAYNQACKEKSGFADGWYQVAVKTEGSGSKLVITLESDSGIPAGSKIGMDDLTVQFASTIGFLQFSSTNATAAGECLVP